MKYINDELLNSVSDKAKKSERLRMNHNFHESLDAKVNRLLNDLEPGTYLPPHRHKDPDKEEIYLVLRGALLAITFDEEGNITEKLELNPLKGQYGIEIPAGTWHSIIVLEPNTVIYEIKEGPFAPLSPDNFASWAPAPTDVEGAKAYMEKMLKA